MTPESAEVRSDPWAPAPYDAIEDDTCQWHVDNLRTICGNPMPCSRHQHDKQGHPFGFTVHETEESFMAEVRSPSPSVDLPKESPERRLLLGLIDTIYGGAERADNFPDRLRAIADVLDKVDTVVDEYAEERGTTHRVGRGFQSDLREAAAALASFDPASPSDGGLDDTDVAALNELERDLAAGEVEHMGDVWQRIRAILDAPGQRALQSRLSGSPSESED